MPGFQCLSISSACLPHPAVALATSRGGGIGILDFEFCADQGRGVHNLRQLRASAGHRGRIGVRATVAQLPQLIEVLIEEPRPVWVVLTPGDATPAALGSALDRLAKHLAWNVLFEVVSASQMESVRARALAGVIAKGYESGGWVGEDTAFVLTQKLLALGVPNVFVQGGIGLHSAAACRAAGAVGVVLDDQLLLMPESGLSAQMQRHLNGLVGNETVVHGERLGLGCRVLARPGFRAVAALGETAARLDDSGADAGEWRSSATTLVGWQSADATAWPIGQAVGFAAAYRDRYKTTGRLVQTLIEGSTRQVQTAARLKPLAPDAPLARSHGTRYPILQGPMTRVSDCAGFAAAVAEAGALPLLALALMRPEQVDTLLTETKALLGDRPWGVGILGFVPQSVREAQFEVIQRVKPSYALIAGGRPDQAERFEAAGIPAYIHVPSPALLRMFLEQGARRFVFEGRECGGHVGPLSSFVLWEHAVSVLLEAVRPGAEQEIHAVFAGGLHDARSAAMLSALVAPLAERGFNVGVLMGSAYLFTREIVASGAIVPAFQEQALACRETVTLETGQGHASRCAVTEFAHEFYRTRRTLRGEGRSADEIRDSLEDLSLGRLRAASKGELRDVAGDLRQLDEAAQVREGMYMIGQVATLRHAPLTLAELHRQVCEDGQALLESHAPPAAVSNLARPTDIAVIGIGTLLPKAYQAEQFWSNIVAKLDAITEIPLQRWDWRLYFDEDRRARDKVYSKWGGFLDELEFDPVTFGIPPNSVRSIDPIQLLGLEVVRRALEDAGYSEGGLDNEHTSVILGASGGLGDLGLQYGMRSELPRFSEVIPDEVWNRLPEWTEESFAGTLLNVVSGRIANRFNFGGLNCTVDAACASSLSAIHLAVSELESGRSNTVVAGGVDTVQSPFGYLCFSKTQALTPRGRARTFDRDSDGIVISEGLAVVVLKRLADAERDGDRIYSVIKATGGSSDGKALGLTAPRPEGQMRALRRAYQRAGFGPNTLGLIEAHGTGTAVGDRAETETVVRTLREHGTPARECAIGSVKTLIGHTKATAGIAGLIKVALALHHKVLPPHCNVTNPIEPIADPSSPIYLCKEALPWVRHPDHPRRGAVSAFGFGGTNFHAVMEEYCGDLRPRAAPPGGHDWPFELLVVRGNAEADLRKQLETLQAALQAGAAPRLADLAFSLALRADERRDAALTIALVVDGLEHLSKSLATVLAQPRWAGAALPPNVAFGERLQDPTLAFVFPGQGAQYPEMGREATMYFPELRSAVEAADRQLRDHFPQRLSRYIFPPSAFNEAGEAENLKRITDTHVAQPAIGTLAVGFLDLLARLGLTPSMVAGHSYGEYAALHAAGAMGRKAFLEISEIRGRVMAEAGKAADAGAMAAIQGDRDKVAELLHGYPDVGIANHNSPSQCVISGATQSVKRAAEELTQKGFSARLLPVSAAFHSPLVAGAQPQLDAAIGRLGLREPHLPPYSNTTAKPYPGSPAEMQALLARHMLSPVEFVQQIRNMHDDGARVFVELGPKTMLARMIGQTLEGRPHVAVCIGGGGDMRGTLLALGTLAACGAPVGLRALFDDRLVQALNLERLAETTSRKPMSATAWYLTGGGLRKPTEPAMRTGKQVALTVETRPQEETRFLDSVVAQRATPSAAPAMQSQPALAPAALPVPANAAPVAQVGEAWNAYQQTMRQFLNLQEQVMRQYLGGPGSASGIGPIALPQPAAPMVSVPAAVAPTLIATVPPSLASTAPAKPVPVAAVALIGPSREELSQLLLNLVSERTGYPVEMLGMTQDLEAELGIDSIKRVEILGALHQKLPQALGESVRGSMEQLTRVKTMAALLDRLAEAAPAATAMPVQPATPVAAAAAVSGPSREELSQLLLNLVSERTGYPVEMLGMTQDLEAELGIDSIKRVEILGALHQKLPQALGESVRGSMEQLTRVKTMAALLDRLAEAAPAATAMPVQPATPVAAAAAVSGPSREELSQLLLNLVSERTGYPVEMLGMTQDLEAELGIDSIKRVEILGALHQKLPQALGESVRGSMEQLTRVKTMAALLDRLAEAAPAATAMPVQPATPAAAAAAVSGPSREELSQLLLNLVSERTGYPVEMLGMTQDLEAELGIDSIKRVEILGALHQQLPQALGESVRGSMEQLTRVKTLAALLDRLTTASAAPAAPAAAVSAPSPAVSPMSAARTEPAASEIAPSRTPRYVIAPRAAPLRAVSVAHLSGLYLVLGGEPGLASIVVDSLRKRGADAHGVEQATLRDAGRVAEQVEALRKTAGPVAGVVHLAGLAAAVVPESLDVWRAMAAVQTKSLFELLKHCAGDLSQGGRVVAATAFGGRFGRDGLAAATPATAAGVSGLLKTLAYEWPEATLKVVDFDPAASADSVAAALVQELLIGDREVEVGFAEGTRYVFGVAAAPFPQPRPEMHRLEDHSVILVTAGARGITAEVVSRLARPTFTLVVLGRLPEPGEAQDRFGALVTPAELRQGLLADARQRGEQVTPVEIERRVQDVLRAREIGRNLAKLKASGATVEYFAVDVRDEPAFGAAIDGIYARHGRLDAVIHGAGIIEDKLLADKSTQSFERVFDTKVDSAFILARHLRPEGLRLVVFFTSVAGVFGNRGQSDYAAANEVVNRLGMQLEQRWKDTRVVAINWGPWDNPGMASEEVRKQFRDRGIVPISTVEGCRFFVDEIRHGHRGEVEVVAGEGPWSPGLGLPREAAASLAAPMVLLRGKPHVQPNGTVLLEHRLGLASEPFLEDHRLDQRPVLPAAAALELMAEFVQAAWPELHVSEVSSLSVLRGIALEPGADKTLVLSAKTSSHAEADSVQVSVEILEPKTRVPYYRAYVTLRPQLAEAPLSSLAPLAAGSGIEAAPAYRKYLFHGPRFHLIDRIDALDEQGAAATVSPSIPGHWVGGLRASGAASWLFDPGLVDTAPQLAIVWSRTRFDATPLPSRMASVRRFSGGPVAGPLRLMLSVHAGSSEHGLVYDAEFIDSQGRVRLELRGVESTGSAALNRLAAS